MPLAQIVVLDDVLLLKTPYHPGFVDALKLEVDWHQRKWDAASKVWEVHRAYRDIVIQICERFYGLVDIDDQTSPTPSQPAITAGGWIDAMFEALPEHLHTAAYRNLAKALHPDRGGDVDLMQQLTAAYVRRQR